MALSNAEKQRRYRERHVMVPRDPAIALAPQAVPVPPPVPTDLTEVHAALAEARHVLSNRYPHLPVLCQQVQTLMTVLERVVAALEASSGP